MVKLCRINRSGPSFRDTVYIQSPQGDNAEFAPSKCCCLKM